MPNFDRQISGVQPGPTPEGDVRSMEVASGLALVPFRRNIGYWTIKNGTGINEYREEGDLFSGGYPVHFYAASTGVGNSMETGFKFPGRRFGLSIVRNMPINEPISVMIDGRAYRVQTATPRQVDATTGGPIHPTNVLIADNLRDRPDHECLITCRATAAKGPTWLFLGALLESRFGFVTPPVTPRALEPITLTTSAANFPHDNGGATAGGGFRAFRRVEYYNSTGAPVAVTISRNGVDFWKKSVPAGDTVSFDPGTLTAYNETVTGSIAGGYQYQHRAASAASIVATLFGVH